MADEFSIAGDDASSLRLMGALDLYSAGKARIALKKKLGPHVKSIDVSSLTKLDTVGALLLKQLQDNQHIAIDKLKPEHSELFKLVSKIKLSDPPAPLPQKSFLPRMLIAIGGCTVRAKEASLEMIAFFGQTCVTLGKNFFSPKHWRVADIMHHIEDTGINAIPIISVMAFMIAVVLAYQGVAQLRPMGAEHLTVNLVAISVVREMGVLLTAIMVAGRSGSAFTAEIGVMKVREEVDALQVIGIAPFEVLVLPRLIALLITLPLLTFLADIMGLVGGGVMSALLIGIAPGAYMDRVHSVITGTAFIVGMVKAPVFAFLIAMVGCMHGMKVSGSAESVGSETTASVVKSIFLVLIADALFSILFERAGV